MRYRAIPEQARLYCKSLPSDTPCKDASTSCKQWGEKTVHAQRSERVKSNIYEFRAEIRGNHIEARGSPLRGIFSWARWGQGPGQIPELLAHHRRRRIRT